MKSNVIAAALLAAGLVLGGFLVGGRYEIVAEEDNSVARLDRFTGAVEMCVVGAKQPSCGFELEGAPRDTE